MIVALAVSGITFTAGLPMSKVGIWIELGIRNQTLHQVDEFVYLSEIKELTKIYFRIIENYFKKN